MSVSIIRLSEMRVRARGCGRYMDSMIGTWKEIVLQRKKRLRMKSKMALVDNGTEENVDDVDEGRSSQMKGHSTF